MKTSSIETLDKLWESVKMLEGWYVQIEGRNKTFMFLSFGNKINYYNWRILKWTKQI
jgi:hypothetical protein